MIVTSVPYSRWQAAQEYERQANSRMVLSGLRWNQWWFNVFGGYEILRGCNFPNVLEVGCGRDTNVRLILPLIKFERLYLEDPLIADYLPTLKQRINYPMQFVDFASASLENLPWYFTGFDLLICINVLDHVQDAIQCFAEMRRVLKPGGVLILGQDLSNAEDYKLCPDSWDDVGHPIKLDEETINAQLPSFTPLYKKVLPREQGRNPRCHYGTMALIARKDFIKT